MVVSNYMNRKDYGEIFCKGKNVSLNATQSYYEGGQDVR